jgi:hypothetical protein
MSGLKFASVEVMTKEAVRAEGYEPLAGPYYANEVALFDRVVAEAVACGKQLAFTEDGTRPRGLHVWQRRRR